MIANHSQVLFKLMKCIEVEVRSTAEESGVMAFPTKHPLSQRYQSIRKGILLP